MQNPFVYGEIVPDEAFVDRVVELDRLIADLGSGQKVFLISPRRYGKSSLIRQTLHSLARRGVLTVDVTVSSYSSYLAFLEGYARALAEVDTRLERARTWLVEAITSTRPEIRYEPKETGLGRFSVAFPVVTTSRDINRLAAEVFELPGRLATERNRTVVVALDEFQAVAAFDGGGIENALRAAAQQQRRVGYVFAGSEPTLMERMISPRRPFYKAGPVMRLEKIPADVFAEFLEARFAASGIRAEPGLGAAIVELAANLPYDVQRLAHETWDDLRAAGGRRAALEHLHATLARLLAEQNTIARPCAPPCCRTAASCCPPTPARGTGSAAPQPSRPRSPRSSDRTCSSRNSSDTLSLIPCFVNGSRGRRTEPNGDRTVPRQGGRESHDRLAPRGRQPSETPAACDDPCSRDAAQQSACPRRCGVGP